jgi:Ca-activated chloride channel family protein
MSFTWPLALAALALLPVLVAVYIDRDRRRVASQAEFGNPDLLPNVVDREPGRLRYLPPLILLVALVFMIVGVARPHATVNVPREEATIVLAMDTSRSMKATDVEPTRLDAARVAAKTFLDEVPEKFRVGVVSFATRAAVGVAPT